MQLAVAVAERQQRGLAVRWRGCGEDCGRRGISEGHISLQRAGNLWIEFAGGRTHTSRKTKTL